MYITLNPKPHRVETSQDTENHSPYALGVETCYCVYSGCLRKCCAIDVGYEFDGPGRQ